PPLCALADQRNFAGALDRQLIFDERRHLLRRRADQLCERRATVPEHPRVTVLVGPERRPHSHLFEQRAQRLRGMRLRRVFRVFGLLDPHAARSFSRQSGSSSRKRRMRSATGGCVTNMRARPSSIKGLTVYSGSVAGLAANSTNSAAWSRRTSASAIGCGEPQIAAAAWSARNSRFGESIR